MSNTIRIKRRAAGGAAGAPVTLSNAELAFNEQDYTLYYGYGTASGTDASQVIAIGGSGAFLTLGTTQTVTGNKTFNGAIVISGSTTVNNISVNGGTISSTQASFILLGEPTTIDFGALASTLNIGANTGTTTVRNNINVSGNATIGGNLTVNGTLTAINSTTISVDDINIELGSTASPTDTTANGGGITLKGSTDKTIVWDLSNGNWTSSEHWNVASGKSYKINNAVVLNATTLGSGVVNSSLTSVGTITTGVWNASAIGVIYGGTGQSSYVKGDLLYADASNSLSKLTIGSTDQFLQVKNGVPTWQSTIDGGEF